MITIIFSLTNIQNESIKIKGLLLDLQENNEFRKNVGFLEDQKHPVKSIVQYNV